MRQSKKMIQKRKSIALHFGVHLKDVVHYEDDYDDDYGDEDESEVEEY